MIKIVDNSHGVRLLYDDIEVFNHTSLFPFAKIINGTEKYKRQNGVISGYFDIDSEFQLNEYSVKSASVKSANIEFRGYNDSSLLISIVEEKDRLALHLTPSSKSLKLQFIVGSYNVLINGEDALGKTLSNIEPQSVGLFVNLRDKAVKIVENTVRLENLTLQFSTNALTSFDLKKAPSFSITFLECPECIYFIKNNK